MKDPIHLPAYQETLVANETVLIGQAGGGLEIVEGVYNGKVSGFSTSNGPHYHLSTVHGEEHAFPAIWLWVQE